MSSSESKFEIDLGAKTKAFNLRVRLKGALWAGSPVGKAHRVVSGSVRARCRTLILRVSLTLLQVFGGQTPQQQQHQTEVRYSLRIRLRKLWLRVRGIHHQQEIPPRKQLTTGTESVTSSKKPKWRRSVSSVGRQLLGRSKSSEKMTSALFQDPVKENGYVAQYMDALGPDRVVRVVHGVGMVSTFLVLVQLAGTRGLPLFVTLVTGLAIVGRLVFLNRFSFLGPGVQQVWHEAMSVGGISLVPQVFRAASRPYFPQWSITASESVMCTFTLILIFLVPASECRLTMNQVTKILNLATARYGRLPFKFMRLFGIVSAGIPVILILWAPILQLWNCCWSPANVNYTQVFTGLLAVLSNGLSGYSQSYPN